jgi:hypothetical protein
VLKVHGTCRQIPSKKRHLKHGRKLPPFSWRAAEKCLG